MRIVTREIKANSMHDTREGKKSTLTNKMLTINKKTCLPTILFTYTYTITNLFNSSFTVFRNIFGLDKSGIIYLLSFNNIIIYIIVSWLDTSAISPFYPCSVYSDRDKIDRSFFLS